ncbi:MAG: YqeG family HAD IIIA-type phosphatase ['Conium maculatum' witches'-broom phytoplasma]|nr:YqeG family HAD IIIA-type phosphatase ['Conium maculatum' witches'-broom phytoplasma]
MEKANKYLPEFYYDSFLDIPYDDLAKKGVKALFFDLDNTLLENKQNALSEENKQFLQQMQPLFKIVILSNASKKRLATVLKSDFDYIPLTFFRKKPSSWGFLKALEQFNVSAEETVMIGDQLRTDILGANKMKITSILVKPINRNNESLVSRLSRYFIERPYIKKIKKNNPKIYQQKFKNFVELEK